MRMYAVLLVKSLSFFFFQREHSFIDIPSEKKKYTIDKKAIKMHRYKRAKFDELDFSPIGLKYYL